MELYIGGYAQGKLAYVKKIHEGQELQIVDGAQAAKKRLEPAGGRVVFNHFHLLIKEFLKRGGEPEALIEELLVSFPDCIVISDEVGNGIVPMQAEEREFRERTGRILIQLAADAERVERVLCGLGQRLK